MFLSEGEQQQSTLAAGLTKIAGLIMLMSSNNPALAKIKASFALTGHQEMVLSWPEATARLQNQFASNLNSLPSTKPRLLMTEQFFEPMERRSASAQSL